MPRFVTLVGGGPWGFRLVGGSDFRANLAISKITPGGKADVAGLKPGDVIMAINGNDTSQSTHLDAQNQVKNSKTTLTLNIESNSDPRSPTDQRSPDVAPTRTTSVPKPSYKSTTSIPTNTWQPAKPQTSYNDSALPPPPASLLNQAPAKSPDLPPPPPSVTVPVSKSSSENRDLFCEGCRQQIRGPYLTAQGKNWHPDEFICASQNCGRPLQNCGFIEEKGQRYCAGCYEKYFAQTCHDCHKKIVGEVMHALNETWHVTCFVCTDCKQAFRDGVFHLHNEKPYCVADYNRLFGTICKGCGFAIEAGDHYVEAIKQQWHETCFTCAVCHVDLKNAGFFAVNEKPVCSNHKNARLPA
ncbi:PDZ and LIM domain protein 7-like [Ciona intestinalis]